ncbi:MAG: hypothetical protein JJE04_07265 [Acidobacteriia bacterium]|nr:hypothetical protein [Terriglobia bacterium]
MLLKSLGAIALAAACFGGGTSLWEHNTQQDFEKGKLKRLSLRSDGRLSLAPVFRELHDPSTAYLWAVSEDSKGRLFFGGGGLDSSSAKLFQLAPGTKPQVAAEFPGLEIHGIAIDRQDRVYAATSPDGKVYRLAADGKAELFYDPKAKYIWALVFDASGNLYVATGDKGEIHKVTPAGVGSVFFQTEEGHARSLAVDASGNLFAGTEPGGLVLRISPSGQGFVLYQSSKREITSLVVNAAGAVFATAVGNKQTAPAPLMMPLPPQTMPAPPTVQAAAGPANRPPTSSPAPISSLGASITGGSELIRIDPDGYPRRIWSHQAEIAYSVVLDQKGLPIVGTGNKGGIFRVENDLLSTQLVNAAPTQVTALAVGRGGKIFAVTGNIGKLYQLGPELETEGSYESEVLDAGFFSYWGRLRSLGPAAGGSVTLESRSGNLDAAQKNWSAWAKVDASGAGGRITSPAARFLQYRLNLTGGAHVSSVDLAYMPKNVAPTLEIVSITPANYRFPQQSLSFTQPRTLTLQPLGRPNRSASSSLSGDSSSVTLSHAKGYVGARWLAKDENADDLISTIEIRGAKESNWKLLKDKIKERHFSWDSTAFPDGEYVVRVTASDAPDNPPDQALTAAIESDPFIIDNTPPVISALAATRSGSRAELRWHAVDAGNRIDSAEYSLDGGEWIVVLPTTRLTDSPAHDYKLVLDKVTAGEHTLAIRVTDENDNQAVDKVVLTP